MQRAQDRARSARSRKNGARSATIESRALGALKLASEGRDENVPAKRADFFKYIFCNYKNLRVDRSSVVPYFWSHKFLSRYLILHG